ncbi:hypothetical protein [Halonatronum saccharophilum]|uniref:hypothetical protein n=1 Tax=Halonatronum saccharophilum TaxID=150060 RepID=UPI00048836AC|nr:hypothetical protein [Halonatronum saccharophilum]
MSKRAIVISSTFNQMINFIPIIEMCKDSDDNFDKEKIKNLTIYNLSEAEEKEETSDKFLFSRFDNGMWDSNLKKVLKEVLVNGDMENIKIEDKSIESIKGNIIVRIENEDYQEVVFNITGGQRNSVLAMMQAGKELKESIDDVKLMYLEGNKAKKHIIAIDDFFNGGDCEEVKNYSLPEGFNIENALNLMGYTVKDSSTENLLGEENKYKSYLKIIDDKDKEFIYKLTKLNKNKVTDEEEKEIKNIKEELRNLVTKDIEGDFNQSNPFGYILEKIVIAKLVEEIKGDAKLEEQIIDLRHNVNTYDNHHIEKAYNSCSFEHDICLLTNSGQVIALECKSGTASSDTLKARKYTAYTIGGAYAVPVLITPFFKEDIDDLTQDNLKEYENIKRTLRGAFRARLEIWGLDELNKKDAKSKLKELLKKQSL